jgi:hypothetical protein
MSFFVADRASLGLSHFGNHAEERGKLGVDFFASRDQVFDADDESVDS